MNKADMERVAMLALMPGMEYFLQKFDRFVAGLRAELEAFYGQARNGAGGHTVAAEEPLPAAAAVPLLEDDTEWITAEEGAKRAGVEKKYFRGRAKALRVKTRPMPSVQQHGPRLLYHAADAERKLARRVVHGKHPHQVPEVKVMKKRGRPPGGKQPQAGRTSRVDPPMIDGWYTKRGLADELGRNVENIDRWASVHQLKLRSRRVPPPPGSGNNVHRRVYHPEDVAVVKAVIEAEAQA